MEDKITGMSDSPRTFNRIPRPGFSYRAYKRNLHRAERSLVGWRYFGRVEIAPGRHTQIVVRT